MEAHWQGRDDYLQIDRCECVLKGDLRYNYMIKKSEGLFEWN